MTRKRKVATVFVAGTLCLAALATAATVTALNERKGDQPQMNARAGRDAPQSNRVRLEHVALNVADPVKTAQWYVDNLGMKILREGPAPTNARFLADADGNMMLELYRNPPDAVPNYASMDPLVAARRVSWSMTWKPSEQAPRRGRHGDGRGHDHSGRRQITMLRDPWGLAIQFIRRANPMLLHK